MLSDPHYLPYRFDPIGRRVLWLRLDTAQRRKASFLDERAIPRQAQGAWAPMASLADTGATPGNAPHAIFHIGHCGSTLLSRLLEEWPQVQALREPLPLRTLAAMWPDRHQPWSRLSSGEADVALGLLWRALGRPLPPSEYTVVKATSSCNGLIAPLLEGNPSLRVVLLDLPLEPYLATLLKSDNSMLDAASAADERLRFLHMCGLAGDVALHSLSLPMQCAMGWLAEQLRFSNLERTYAGRVLRIDFEQLLRTPVATLEAVARHYGLDAGYVAAAAGSDAWRRYSKAPDHDYSAADRAHDLELAARRFEAPLQEGLAWVRAHCAQEPHLEEIAATRIQSANF